MPLLLPQVIKITCAHIHVAIHSYYGRMDTTNLVHETALCTYADLCMCFTACALYWHPLVIIIMNKSHTQLASYTYVATGG